MPATELMVCLDGSVPDDAEMFVVRGDDPDADRRVERAALDFAYEVQRQNPLGLVTIVLVF